MITFSSITLHGSEAARDRFLSTILPEQAVKKLLFMLILSLCAVAWRSEDIVNALGAAGAVSAAESAPLSARTMVADQAGAGQDAMSVEEFARLGKTDPKAYRKFMDSRTVNERTEADKLMNFLSRGKYE